MKILFSTRSLRAIKCILVLSVLASIAIQPVAAQNGTLTLLQFANGASSNSKIAEQAVARMTPCEVIGIDAGPVIRCLCPIGFNVSALGSSPEKSATRPIGSTQLHADGSATFQGLAPYPVFHLSSDPDGDDDRYTAWKTAWITAFPDRYAALVNNPIENDQR